MPGLLMRRFDLNIVLYLAFACFIFSLALPGIVYKPDILANPKLEECSFAAIDGVQCSKFYPLDGSGYLSCTRADEKSSSFIDKNKILEYCDGYTTPWTRVDYGYSVLLLGWLGIFIGMYAWFSNLLFAIIISFVKQKLYLRSLVLSVMAFVIGLQSFFFDRMYLDESGSNWLEVDYLGIGFYVWELSFLILIIYTFFRVRKAGK